MRQLSCVVATRSLIFSVCATYSYIRNVLKQVLTSCMADVIIKCNKCTINKENIQAEIYAKLYYYICVTQECMYVLYTVHKR